MREIKFRVWDKDDQDWIDLELWNISLQLDGSIWARFDNDDWIDFGPGERFILQQYTGLKDKNRVEIYEGDIVQEGRQKYKIIWAQSMAGFKKRPINKFGKEPDELMNKSDTLEVIGNIYENKELLNAS